MCTNLWIEYLRNFLMYHAAKEMDDQAVKDKKEQLIRGQFERAADVCRHHFYLDKIIKLHAEWELRMENRERCFILWETLLRMALPHQTKAAHWNE